MTTKKKISSNKQNAQLSTGPRTSEGKQSSSQNALKHGLRALSPLLPDERQADYDEFRRAHLESLRPVGATEETLALQAIHAWWRLLRFERIETGLLQRAQAEAKVRAALDAVNELNSRARRRSYTIAMGGSEAQFKRAEIRKDDASLNERAGTHSEWIRATNHVTKVQEEVRAQSEITLANEFSISDSEFEKLSRYERSLHKQSLSSLGTLALLQSQRRAGQGAPESEEEGPRQLQRAQ